MELLERLWVVVSAAGGSLALFFIVALAVGLLALTGLYVGSAIIVLTGIYIARREAMMNQRAARAAVAAAGDPARPVPDAKIGRDAE
mgnify:CR=1 FL=1